LIFFQKKYIPNLECYNDFINQKKDKRI